ncbi:MAG: hypothetical protein AB1540_14525 [Bdellovibrionota bacterium]
MGNNGWGEGVKTPGHSNCGKIAGQVVDRFVRIKEPERLIAKMNRDEVRYQLGLADSAKQRGEVINLPWKSWEEITPRRSRSSIQASLRKQLEPEEFAAFSKLMRMEENPEIKELVRRTRSIVKQYREAREEGRPYTSEYRSIDSLDPNSSRRANEVRLDEYLTPDERQDLKAALHSKAKQGHVGKVADSPSTAQPARRTVEEAVSSKQSKDNAQAAVPGEQVRSLIDAARKVIQQASSDPSYLPPVKMKEQLAPQGMSLKMVRKTLADRLTPEEQKELWQIFAKKRSTERLKDKTQVTKQEPHIDRSQKSNQAELVIEAAREILKNADTDPDYSPPFKMVENLALKGMSGRELRRIVETHLSNDEKNRLRLIFHKKRHEERSKTRVEPPNTSSPTLQLVEAARKILRDAAANPNYISPVGRLAEIAPQKLSVDRMLKVLANNLSDRERTTLKRLLRKRRIEDALKKRPKVDATKQTDLDRMVLDYRQTKFRKIKAKIWEQSLKILKQEFYDYHWIKRYHLGEEDLASLAIETVDNLLRDARLDYYLAKRWLRTSFGFRVKLKVMNHALRQMGVGITEEMKKIFWKRTEANGKLLSQGISNPSNEQLAEMISSLGNREITVSSDQVKQFLEAEREAFPSVASLESQDFKDPESSDPIVNFIADDDFE